MSDGALPTRTRRAVVSVGVLGALLTVAPLVFGGTSFITQVIANGTGVAIGLVIVVRGSTAAARRMGWLVTMAMLAIKFSTLAAGTEWLFDRGMEEAATWAALVVGSPTAELGIGLLSPLAIFPVMFLAVAFPDGRLAQGWRWYPPTVFVLFTAMAGAAALSPPHVGVTRREHPLFEDFVSPTWTSIAEILLLATVVLFLISVSSLVTRFRSASTTPDTRQQIKWFAYGLTLYLVTLLALLVLEILDLTTSEAFLVVDGLAFTAIPMSLGVAILRYRLYDIDRIISRTLAYALTFALLTGVFVLIAASPVLVAGSDADTFPPLLVSVSTLVVAALFNPLRRRLVRGLERRFDRARYDAEQVIELFSDRVNDLTDVDEIEAGLTEVLSRTLGPTSVGIWIADRSP